MNKITTLFAACLMLIGNALVASDGGVMVTFSVDMNQYAGSADYIAEGVHFNGTDNGWCGTCEPMDDSDGDGVYAVTRMMATGDMDYKFVVGNWSDSDQFPEVILGCTNDGSTGFINRMITVTVDVVLPTVCFSSCDACMTVTIDEMCGAEEIMMGTTISTDNTGMTADGPQAGCWFDADVESDIWFFFTAPASGAVEVETYDTGFNDDTQLAIYSSSDGTCTGDTMMVGCNDDISGSDYMSLVQAYGLTPGDTYFIQVDGWQGTSGAFDMSITELTNDDFCNAFSITVDGGTVGGSNLGMSADGPQAACWTDAAGVTGDIWFYFTAPASGAVEVETFDIGDNDDTQVAVYSSTDGTCLGDTTMVGCSDDISNTDYMSLVEISGMTPGATYFIQVDGWGTTTGAFEIEVRSVTTVAECLAPAAVICDNFDDYTLGSISGQAAHWVPWPGGTLMATVTDLQSFSNGQSIRVRSGGVEDNLLLLGNQSTGYWTLNWMMFIPADSTGYFNIQNAETPGTWNMDVDFNAGGASAGTGGVQQSGASFTYPEDAWFAVEFTFDLNNNVATFTVDGNVVEAAYVYAGNIGSINFYSIDGNNTYYLDDVVFDGDPTVGLTNYTEGLFQISPNPTEGNFTVQGNTNINSVVVRNILGATVAKIQTPMSQRVDIDLSGMESGMYFVEIQVGDVINVQRVIKQ